MNVYDEPKRNIYTEIKREFIEDTNTPKTNILNNKYRLIKIKQKGAFGSVYESIDITTGKTVAIKQINNEFSSCIDTEIKANNILNKAGCLHITKMLNHFSDEKSSYLVFEYSEIGDVITFAENHYSEYSEFVDKYTRDIIRDVCIALFCCHKNNICHRDVKPENTLIFKVEDKVIYKLCDLGLSECSSKQVLEGAGTKQYTAPEVYSNTGHYCDKSDMWSVGIMAYSLRYLRTPYGDMLANERTPEYIFSRESLADYFYSAINRIKEEDFRSFLLGLLNIDPNKRMTAREALKHPFLKR